MFVVVLHVLGGIEPNLVQFALAECVPCILPDTAEDREGDDV